MTRVRTVNKKLGELEIGHNIFYEGGIYMVTNTLIHEDDTTVTVKIGYPRKVSDDFELATEITNNAATTIPVYQYV